MYAIYSLKSQSETQSRDNIQRYSNTMAMNMAYYLIQSFYKSPCGHSSSVSSGIHGRSISPFHILHMINVL
jgi:hypothetical protein